MSFAKIVETNVEHALKALFRESIKTAFPAVQVPEILITQGKLGKGETKAADYQCNNAMALAKALSMLQPPVKLAPKDIGEQLAKHIPENDLIEKVVASPQGFINVFLATSWVNGAIQRVAAEGIKPPVVPKESVLVDFSSPNIAKEMHVGHLRSTIIGDSFCRLLEYLGNDVKRINHVGDWGTQFGMLILYLRETHPDFLENPPHIGDLVAFYRAAKKRFDEDELFKDAARKEVVKLQALEEENITAWKMLCDVRRTEFEQIYSRLNIKIEERGESFYNPLIPAVLEQLEKSNLTEMSDGATIIVAKEVKKITDFDVKDMVKLMSSMLITVKRGAAVPEYHPALLEAINKAALLSTNDKGEEIIKLGKAESKPWAKFDAQRDADKLAKMLEPLYKKGAFDPIFLKAFEGILSADKKEITVPRFTFPLMAKKSDGGYTYDTTDLAGMWHRFVDQKHDRVVIVTDAGQYEHFVMCAQVAKDMGWMGPNQRWAHGGFGLVSGEDGKKIKTRSGESAKLKDLLDEAVDRCYATLEEREKGDQKRGHTEEEMRALAKKMGYGAVKYFDLKQNRTTDYAFSYDKMLDTNGNTSVYMLYSYARIRSIQRKAGVTSEELAAITTLDFTTEEEKALGLCALRLGSVLLKTADDLFLHHITDFVYELTGKLSDFYNACRVIGHEQQMSRLVLLEVVAKTMSLCLEILGIDTAEQL